MFFSFEVLLWLKKIHKIYCLDHLLSVQFSSKVEYTHTVMQPDYEIFHL